MRITHGWPLMVDAASAMQQAIDNIRVYDDLYYTERQLYYAYARLFHQAQQQRRWLTQAAAASLPAVTLYRRPLRMIGAAAAGVSLVTAARLYRPPALGPVLPVTDDAFRAALSAYRAAKGEPPGLLPATPPPPLGTAAASREPDLIDYGLNGLLICQHESIAAMLRANMVHLQQGCAIITGPPPDDLLTMLHRTPDARFFFLHDASFDGLQQAYALAATLPISHDHPFVPVGLRPAHVWHLRLLYHTTITRPDDAPTWHSYYLTQGERAWLEAGYMAEVAALPPLYLLQRIERILSGAAVSLLTRDSLRDRLLSRLPGKAD